ncbi:hypothetical protein N9Q27_00070 [bacterium]|nr:hypothetical protein [bacterium]
MSDKVYNLTLPDGTTIPVPAWAREATLSVLVEQLKIGSSLNKSLIKEVTDLNLDTDEIEDSIQDMFTSLENVKLQESEDEKKARAGFAKGIAKATNDVVDSLSDTSQPLTTMTKNAELAAGWLGKGGGQWLRNSTALAETFEGAGDFIAGAADGLGDAFFAYAGFVAGQLESFAKAQTNMINAGAIFFDASVSFDDLRESAAASGITYNQLSEIAMQYGTGLQVLGRGVSGGVTEFLNTFKDLQETSEAFGDFGMSNEQLAAGFAEFIEVSRLTGLVNNRTQDASGVLEQGYTTLLQETTALAALTGKSRDQLLAEQNEALKNPTTAAALIRMEERGFGDEAEVISSIVRQLANTAEYLPAGVSDMIQLAIGTAYGELEAGENISNVDLRAALRAADPSGSVSTILNSSGIDIMEKIQTAVANGSTPDDIRSFIYEEIAAIDEGIDADIRMNTGTLSDYAAMVLEFRTKSILADKDFATLLRGTEEERNAVYADMQQQLATSGTATLALNDLTKLFLQAQSKLTPDLDKSAAYARSIAGGMEHIANLLNGQTSADNDSGIGGGLNPLVTAQITTEQRDQQLNDGLEDGTIPENYEDPIGDAPVLEFDQAIMDEFIGMMTQSGGTPDSFTDIIHGEVMRMPHPVNRGVTAFMKMREFGGTVTPAANNHGYVVGEAGPEYFEPTGDGKIIPFSEMTSIIETSARAIDAFTSAVGKIDLSSISDFTQTTLQSLAGKMVENVMTEVDTVDTASLGAFGGQGSMVIDGIGINELLGDLNIPNSALDLQAQFESGVGLDVFGGSDTPVTPTTVTKTENSQPINELNTSTVGTVSNTSNNQIVQNVPPSPNQTNNNSNSPDFEEFKTKMQELASVKETYSSVIMALRDEVRKYQRINDTGRTFG